MPFDEESQEHWEEAGKARDAVLKTVHRDGSRTQQFFAYKRALTIEEGKVLYPHPVGDSMYTEHLTLRRYPNE